MFSLESDEGGARPHKGCVYSDGAIDVYFKLNNIDPSHFSKAKLDPSPNSKAKSMTQVSIGKTLNRVHPTPAKMTHLHHHEAVRVGNWQILCLLRERFFVVALLIRQISAIAIEDSPRNMILNQPRNLWGHNDVEWLALESCGLSGGLLTIWNKGLFAFRFSFTGTGGDFNAISKSGERRGCGSTESPSERTEFSAFMDDFEVFDISVLGKKFMWFNSDGSTMSRLDRFLLSDGFIQKG
ncbi:hypothetical protein L195_g041396, partial [Trifolium pratense]